MPRAAIFTAIAVAVATSLSLAAIETAEARNRSGAIVAGAIIGLAAGALIGSAIAGAGRRPHVEYEVLNHDPVPDEDGYVSSGDLSQPGYVYTPRSYGYRGRSVHPHVYGHPYGWN
jgi:hypothetical protein